MHLEYVAIFKRLHKFYILSKRRVKNLEEVKAKKGGMGLTTQILLGLVLGVIFGWAFPAWGVKIKFVGDMFVRMIRMIVVPLIFSSLIMGIAGTGDFKKLGRLALKAIIWFEVATTLALIIGLLVVNIVEPGAGVDVASFGVKASAATATKKIDMVQMLIDLVPFNVVNAAATGNMLQLIVFSVFFGVAAAAMGTKGEPVVKLATSIAEIMFKVTYYVMKLAPIGVFALIAFTVGTYGLKMLIPLGKLILSTYFALFVFLALVLAGASAIFKVNIVHFFRVIKEPFTIAFSTAASEAALPVAMEKLEKFGVPRHVITFVLPTGYSFNLDGSTLYSSLAVVFITQMYNMHFSLEHQVVMLLALMLSTKGIAAIPGASIIVIAATCEAFGVPVEGVGIILGVDRILDMARTACNLTGNCIATVAVARWEGEFPDDVLHEGYTKEY